MARPSPPRDLRDVHLQNAKLAQQKFIQKDTCWSPGSGSNSDGAVTIQSHIPIGFFGLGDVLVRFPKPLKRIMIASIGPTQAQGDYGLQIHLNPLGITYGASYVQSGTENWIQIVSPFEVSVVYVEGTIIEFSTPVDQIYFDVQGPANNQYNITFKDATDVKVLWRPQANSLG